MRALTRASEGGVELRLRVTPKSSSSEILGASAASDGSMSLAVKVSAAPDKGKANTAVIELLARAFDLPKSRFQVISGETHRNKVVFVACEPQVMEKRLAALLDGFGKDK